MTEQDDIFMNRAIELSEKASLIEKSGGVFGAVVVKDGKIIGEGYNQVIKQNDPTWHAEVHAIREACKQVRSPHLDGAVLYTSCEPCPMCLSTCYWAHINRVFFASTAQDALKYGNFDDAKYYDDLIKKPQDRTLIKISEFKRDDALKVWKKFSELSHKTHY